VLVIYWGFRIEAKEGERRAWRENCALSAREQRLVNDIMAGVRGQRVSVDDYDEDDNVGGGGGGGGGGDGDGGDLDVYQQKELEMTALPSTSSQLESKEARRAKRAARENAILEQHVLPAKSVKLMERIGAGAYGEVFKGSLHGAPCAVKTMKKPVSEDAVVAFRQEILITSQLRHPNGKPTLSRPLDSQIRTTTFSTPRLSCHRSRPNMPHRSTSVEQSSSSKAPAGAATSRP
jgi:hypothetical protein